MHERALWHFFFFTKVLLVYFMSKNEFYFKIYFKAVTTNCHIFRLIFLAKKWLITFLITVNFTV